MTTFTVVIRLQRDDVAADRRALADLASLPPGAPVVLKVGTRAYPPASTVALLTEATARLIVDVQGSARAVSAWVGSLQQPAKVWGERR